MMYNHVRFIVDCVKVSPHKLGPDPDKFAIVFRNPVVKASLDIITIQIYTGGSPK